MCYICVTYKAIIAPHFEYCTILIINMGETQLDMLQRAQNRAMRVILHCDKYTKIEHAGLAVYVCKTKVTLYCIFIYKILNNMLPLRSKIEIVGEPETHETGR